MHLKQLEVFVAVARLKSFSKAADTLYLTQPTVSAHMSALETNLGCQLVTRSTRETRLTPGGEVLYGYATQILGLCQRAEQAVKTAASDIRGVLAIAASTVPSQYLVPQILPHLHARYPDVFFQVYQGDSDQVAQRLFAHEAEVGLMGSPIQRAGFVCVPFLTERMVIAAPNSAPYRALGGAMTLNALRDADYLTREPGSGTRKRAEEFLRSLGLDPKALRCAAQLQSTESILRGVQNGLGLAIVSGIAARDANRAGQILIFDYDSPLLERRFFLIHHATRPLSPAAQMLLDEVPRVFDGEPSRA